MAQRSGRFTQEQVFRRRRVVAALLFLAVLAGVLTLVTRVVNAGASSASSGVSSATADADSENASDSEAACDVSALSVAAVTDKTTYAADEDPVFQIDLTNTGSVACTVNAGTSQLSMTVTSGSETIWQSTDCPAQAASADPYNDYFTVIEPGQTLESVAYTWKRVFSDASACDASAQAATGGGAAYWLNVAVGSVATSGDGGKQFFLQ